MDASSRVIDKAGKKLIAQKKATIMNEHANEKAIQEKDILTLLSKLVKANIKDVN